MVVVKNVTMKELEVALLIAEKRDVTSVIDAYALVKVAQEVEITPLGDVMDWSMFSQKAC